MENQAATKPTNAIPPGTMHWGEDFRWRDTRPSANCCYPTGARRPVGSRPSRCRSVAEGDRWARAQAAFVEFVLFLVPPDASKISVPPRLRENPRPRHPLCELSVFARNPRAPGTTNSPTSRASITITSTAALSTSTTLFHFRDLLCHSLASPRAPSSPKKPSCPSRLRVKPPRAKPRAL